MKKNYKKNSKGSNRKGAKGYGKGSENETLDTKSARAGSSHNDISWYVPSGINLQDVASLNFAEANDGQIEVEIAPWGKQVSNVHIPGICTVDLLPSIGVNTGMPDAPTSAINLAVKSMEAFIRAQISGSRTWESNDLGLAILAFDGITSLWSYLVRLYGCVNLYNYENKYLPTGLLVAMGIPQDVAKTAPAYQNRLRNIINMMALRLSTFPIVKLPYLDRHIYLSGNIFMDNPNTMKGQMYVYNLNKVFAINQGGTGCDALNIMPDFSKVNTYSEFLNHIEALVLDIIDRIHYSTDLSIIAGDILKAYGDASLMNIGMIPEDLRIGPTYDETILTQIHNASVIPLGANSSATFGVSQVINANNQYLIQDTGKYTRTAFTRRVIDLPYSSVTPENVMYATRLMSMIFPTGTDINNAPLCSGSEIVSGLKIWRLEQGRFISHTMPSDVISTSGSLPIGDVRKLALASQFKDFPLVTVCYEPGSNSNSVEAYLNGEIQNATSISNVDLKKIHDVAFAGLFGMPYTLKK